MKTQEEIKTPLPEGGDRAIVFYASASGAPVAKGRATQATIVEYQGDRQLAVTFLDLGNGLSGD